MNTKFTYIQFPLFILRKAHEDFDLMAEYILAYGIHQKSLKESVSGSKPFSMALGLAYLNLPHLSDETLDKMKLMAETTEGYRDEFITAKGKAYPMPNIKVQLLQGLLLEKPSQKKIDEFLAYVSVQSIVGKRKYFKTNNKHVLARMMGFSSFSELDVYGLENLSPHLQELYSRYLVRGKNEISKSRMKTLFNKLMNKWRVIKVTQDTRGYYVGMQDKVTATELANVIRKQKRKNKAKEIEREFKMALKIAS
jgi:hypothetical protein